MKLGINIHHASGHCCKGFQRQTSTSNRTIANSKSKRMTTDSLGSIGHYNRHSPRRHRHGWIHYHLGQIHGSR